MTDESNAEASLERELARQVAAPQVSRAEVVALLSKLPGRFELGALWMAMARNAGFENWRRHASYQVVIERVIAYPCAFAAFEPQALAPFGIEARQLIM